MTLSRRSFNKLLAGAVVSLPVSLASKPQTQSETHPTTHTDGTLGSGLNRFIGVDFARRNDETAAFVFEGDGKIVGWKFYGGYSANNHPNWNGSVTP